MPHRAAPDLCAHRGPRTAAQTRALVLQSSGCLALRAVRITNPEPLDHLNRNGSAFEFHGLIGDAHGPDASLAAFNCELARHGQPMLHIKARPPEFTHM